MSIVFIGVDALLYFLGNPKKNLWLNRKESPDPKIDKLVIVDKGGALHFVSSNKNRNPAKIIFTSPVAELLRSSNNDSLVSAILQRAHRASELSKKPPMRLPQDWAEYHYGDLVTFFAAAKSYGTYRWVTQISIGNQDICFWRLITDQSSIDLTKFQPDIDQYARAVEGWELSVAEADKIIATLPSTDVVPLSGAIELAEITSGAVVKNTVYSSWLNLLNEQQRFFVEHETNFPIKLRGPAGSGKTLALAIKAMRELYQDNENGASKRILFATHSWAMAEQVDEILTGLDEKGIATEISVFPLTEIAVEILPKSQFSHASLLGNDSFSGKREQLSRISEILKKMRDTDWPLYALSASNEFKIRVESDYESPSWNSLVWDVMHEFSSVLAASNILPGINAEKKYLSLARTDWMMPLNSDNDKKFVLKVYSDYINGLKSSRLLTIDQVINDLLNYLETFAWNFRRETEGYDLIFVDEFHLFSEQERYVLNYLTRDATEFPRIFMAMDPRQSPYEVYVDFPVEQVNSKQSGHAEEDLGKINSVELIKVHRFSPEILELIKHIHYSYPAFSLGDDWLLDTKAWESKAPNSSIPKLYQTESSDAEVEKTVLSALQIFKKNGNRRLAIILLDDSKGDNFERKLIEAGLPVMYIRSRDDVDAMRYRKKSIVLAAAEYAAGLQFDDVIVSGLPESAVKNTLLNHQWRRLLSLLYLAVSRASENVEIILETAGDDLATLFESAQKAKALEIL